MKKKKGIINLYFMKVIYKSILFIMCCVLSFSLPSFAEETDTNTTIPDPYVTVTNAKINKNSVKFGDTITYKFTLTDVGISELDEAGFFGIYDKGKYYPLDSCVVEVVWQSSKHQVIERFYNWKNRKKKKSLTISDKIKIMDGMQPGEWKIESIHLIDSLGDDTNGGNICISDPRYSKDLVDCYADLSFSDFNVKNKKGTKVDHKAPTINLNSLKV